MEILELQDKYKGKMCFVIGAGPSLHFQNLEPLKDYVTISVNSGILKYQKSLLYLSDDVGSKNWNYHAHLLPTLPDIIYLLYAVKLRQHANKLDKNRIVWFNHKTWYEPSVKKHHPDGLVLTKEAHLPIVGARTSAGSAVHFAYIMGCNPIVLLGCDCCYVQGKRYFWQFPGEPKAFRITHEPVFSCPNAGKVNGKSVDTHSRDFIQYWEEFAKINKDCGTEIIDASEGALTCFKKMKLEEVLDKYGSNKCLKEKLF